MPPIAVFDPKTISMWNTSPNRSGRGRGLELNLGVGMEETSPRLRTGSQS